ncbi:MAG TPA: methyltransferase domain-containing protein [Terrimicrobiaceae bacterium]
MNHPDGKRLLAAVREGDFAHAGEESAVRMTWERLPSHEAQRCLDAGCGRGGTAALVQSNRWGQVTGMDIDEETISFAASAYPAVEFAAADVISAGELFPGRFDIIYAFNAFYAFPDQQAALNALHVAAKPHAILCIFDYVDRGGFGDTAFARKAETLLWRPLCLDSLPAQLGASGWMLKECVEINSEFNQWYAQLVERFASRRDELVGRFTPDLIAYAEDYYRSMLHAIESGALGGAIVYGEAGSH